MKYILTMKMDGMTAPQSRKLKPFDRPLVAGCIISQNTINHAVTTCSHGGTQPCCSPV